MLIAAGIGGLTGIGRLVWQVLQRREAKKTRKLHEQEADDEQE